MNRDRNKKDHPSEGSNSKGDRDRDRDRGKRSDLHNERRQGEREKRDALRREENQKKKDNRSVKRQEERQQRNKREKDERQGPSGTDQKPKTPGDAGLGNSKQPPGKDDKDKVKKYSESRKERRARNDGRSYEKEKDDTKTEHKSERHTDRDEDGQSEKPASDHKSFRDDNKGRSGNSDISVKTRQDRAARVIRNKDRPSLQIYQPGKRRQTGTGDQKSQDGDRPLSKSSSTSTSPTNEEPPPRQDRGKVVDAKTSENSKSADKSSSRYGNQRRSSVKSDDGNKATDGDNKKPAEKKVSRYSERRNRAKEKREAVEIEDNVAKLSESTNDGDLKDKVVPVAKPSWSEGDDRPFFEQID